ncbi:MAG: DEAD/DEAH box helicase [Vicinamibacteria bacterium]|nr:DEAD/DEAH box helicase [Vicinamibacteria bacterium]
MGRASVAGPAGGEQESPETLNLSRPGGRAKSAAGARGRKLSRVKTPAPSAFADLGLAPRLVTVLEELGYEEPTPIQKAAIPPLLEGRDVLGQAATGTGKTAAFALPLLQRSFGEDGRGRHPAILVLVPTRELAMQVAQAMHRYGRGFGVRVLPIYGGQALSLQFRALERGVDVVVATPGRALDHLGRETLSLSTVKAVVLDEADEMLDMGFAEDLEAILQELPAERQTALFSATLPPRIAALARGHLKDPVKLHLAEEKTQKGELPKVRQVAYVVPRAHKLDALARVLDIEGPQSALVFCRTRHEVDSLNEALAGRGYRAESLHGGLSQAQRDRVMRRFREGTVELLLATDVAARGLDIGHLSHVVNYDVPSSAEVYVHRIGRTGRAGREGVAISLCEPRERALLKNVERLTGRRLELLPVPTVADLRARRLELTRASLREALLAGKGAEARGVVASLAEEFDVMDVAAAAVALLRENTERGGDEAEIPEVRERPAFEKKGRFERPERGERPEKKRFDGEDRRRRFVAPGTEEGARPPRERAGAGGAAELPPRKPRFERAEREAAPGEARAPREARPRRGEADFVPLYISVGRLHKVGPGDLVGAITGEAGVTGRALGAIEITDRFSLVEVREAEAERILEAIKGKSIRGRAVTASRYRPKRG